jgi:uncharacterized membrane protein
MLKDEFIHILESSLTGLSEVDRKDILHDYEEHFAIGYLNGRTEQEIATALGDPRTLGKEFNAITLVKKAEETPSASGIGRAILATVGLGLFNLIVVLIPFIILVIVLAVLGILGFCLFCAGPIIIGCSVLEIFGIFTENLPASPYASIFFGIGTTALGLFIILGDYWLARLMYRLGIKYLKWNIAVIHGSESL